MSRKGSNSVHVRHYNERVVLETKRMLADKQLSINEIADALGFEDYSYFSRFFKKQTGMSPTEFRNMK